MGPGWAAALWGFDVSDDLDVGATLPGSDRDVWTREVGGCNGHLGKRSEGISGRSAH